MLIPVANIHKGDKIVREGKTLRVTGKRTVAGTDAETLLGIHKPVGSFIVFDTDAGSLIVANKGVLEVEA